LIPLTQRLIETVGTVFRESLGDTLPMIPILLPVYVALEYFSHRGGRDLIARLRITRRSGPFVGTVLGIIPQCGMSVLVTSFYLLERVTTGTLIATYLATSDEAIPVLIAHRDRLSLVGWLILIKAVTGIGWGYAVDAVVRSTHDDQVKDPARLAPERALHMAPVAWREIVTHGLRRTLRIFLIVCGATIAAGLVLASSSHDWLPVAWTQHANLQIVPVALFGLIPNCAISVAIVEAFLKGGLSAGAAIAGLSAGTGLGPVLLLQDGGWRRTGRVISVTLIAAIVTGFLVNLLIAD
jgi:hypothetical protein